MDKELQFQCTVTPKQTNLKVKKQKRSEAQIEQWEIMRRRSTIVEDKDINIEGVVRLTLSEKSQRFLGCVIGDHVSSEMPWTTIKKEKVQANLTTQNEKSEIFAIKEPLMAFPGAEILVGYIFSAEKPNQFYICITEVAKESVLKMIASNKAEQERRVYNSMYKRSKDWIPWGSEKEVEDNQPKQARPLFEIQVWTAVGHLNRRMAFQDRNVDDVRDACVNFDSRRHKYVTVMRRRTDIAVQAVPEENISIAQTVPPLPSTAWTKYEFHADTQKEIEDEELAKNMKQFLLENSPQMTDLARYNSVFELYKDDYPNLVTAKEDIQIPKKIMYREYKSFMDVKNCKGKVISAAAWHPMWTGIMACAYVDHLQSNENEDDIILQDVFSTNPVLIWSFMDTLNPRLILGSPRKVETLEFCPYNENLLAGGCSNGQVVVWDLCDKLKKVEEEVSLTPNKLKYRLALHTLMGWIKSNRRERFVDPMLVSSLEFSHSSCIVDIKWQSPYYEISRLGRYQGLKANQSTALQFLTCSEDGSVFVWDLNSQRRRRPPKNRPKRKRYKLMTSESDVSYKQLVVFKPHYKFVAESPTSRGYMPLSVVAVEAFPLSYKLQTQTEFGRKLSMTERLSYKPEFQKQKGYPSSKMFIGSVEGQVIQAMWEGYEFNPGGTINSEVLKFTSWGDDHDGPISAISLSPFNKDLILSVGGNVFAIWRQSIKDVPVLWRRSCVSLTSGAWSLFRTSMFFITRVDGAIEVWDFLIHSNKPVLVQSISGDVLTGIYPSKLGPLQNVLGVADISGNFRVFLLPQDHTISDLRNKKAVAKFFYRETECRNFVHERQNRWMECNAEMLQAKKGAAEEEIKKRETEKKTKERLGREKRIQEEKELQKRKLGKYKDYMKEENARKRWKSEQERYLINVLLEKNKLDEATLMDKKVPLDKLKEDDRRKGSKQEGKVKQQNKLTERISMLFPEMVKETSKAGINMDMVLKDLEKIMITFIENYRQNEEKVLTLKMNSIFEYQVNWKELLAEARERRHIIDVELYRSTSRRERYLKTKQERKAKLEALQRKKTESGRQGTSRKGDLQQKKRSKVVKKSGKRIGEEESRIG